MSSLIDLVRQSLKWKQSAKICAERIGIDIEDYLALKDQLTEEHSGPAVDSIVEHHTNLVAGTQKIEAISTSEPKSAEDIIKLLNIDTTKWKLSQYWNKQKKDHWLVSALISQIKPTEVDVLAEVLKNFQPKSPNVELILDPGEGDGGHYCGVFSVQDIHFGKEDNEPVIQEFKAAVVDVTKRCLRGYSILDRLIYVIGGDILNSDTFDGHTTKGTPVENGMHPVEAYAVAFDAVYEAIYQLSAVTKELIVLYVPGNHDRNSSYHLAHALSKAISLNNVTFICDYSERKVYVFGKNFFAFEHGDVNTKNSPMVYAFEFPSEWGATTYRTLYTGHYHMKRTSTFLTENEVNGFSIKIMPSLSRTDYWHYHNKFVGNNRAAILDIHESDLGKVGEICHIAR